MQVKPAVGLSVDGGSQRRWRSAPPGELLIVRPRSDPGRPCQQTRIKANSNWLSPVDSQRGTKPSHCR